MTKSIEVTVEGEEKEDIKNSCKTSKTNIKLTSKMTIIKVGKTYQFKANVSNKAKDTDKKLKWSVSNKKLATINKTTGKFKAKKAGKVVVKASYGNVMKTLKVKIKK